MKKTILVLTAMVTLLLTACAPTRSSYGWRHARTVLNVVFERYQGRHQVSYRGTNRNNYTICARVIAIAPVNVVHVDHAYRFIRIPPGETRYFGRVRAVNISYRSTWTMSFRVRQDGNSC